MYRRAYPERLRAYLQGAKRNRRELRASLRTRRFMTIEAFRIYEHAKRQFVEDVRRAEAAQVLEQKVATGAANTLTPKLIDDLAWITDES